jgi:hypothetical protein
MRLQQFGHRRVRPHGVHVQEAKHRREHPRGRRVSSRYAPWLLRGHRAAQVAPASLARG